MGFYSPVDTFIIMLNKIALRALFALFRFGTKTAKPRLCSGAIFMPFSICAYSMDRRIAQ